MNSLELASGGGRGKKATLPKMAVTKEAESQLVRMQKGLVDLLEAYKETKRIASEISPSDPEYSTVQCELSQLVMNIRTIDRLMKEVISLETVSTQSDANCVPEGTAVVVRPTKPPPHPSSFVKKEDFISSLGLISHEDMVLKNKEKSAKVSRRRRTANTNPRYTSNGFVKMDDLCVRRSKRNDKSNDRSSSPSESSSTSAIQPASIDACYVCYQADYNLTCETCKTKFHSDCIKVTASCAPKPHRLPLCPKCVQATNNSQRSRILNRNSKNQFINHYKINGT